MNDWSKLMITFGDTNDIPADLNKPHSRCGVGLRIAKMKFDPQWRRDNWPFDTACELGHWPRDNFNVARAGNVCCVEKDTC